MNFAIFDTEKILRSYGGQVEYLIRAWYGIGCEPQPLEEIARHLGIAQQAMPFLIREKIASIPRRLGYLDKIMASQQAIPLETLARSEARQREKDAKRRAYEAKCERLA